MKTMLMFLLLTSAVSAQDTTHEIYANHVVMTVDAQGAGIFTLTYRLQKSEDWKWPPFPEELEIVARRHAFMCGEDDEVPREREVVIDIVNQVAVVEVECIRDDGRKVSRVQVSKRLCRELWENPIVRDACRDVGYESRPVKSGS